MGIKYPCIQPFMHNFRKWSYITSCFAWELELQKIVLRVYISQPMQVSSWKGAFIDFVCRGNRPEVPYKIDVIKKVAKLTGKHLCWNHFLIKLQIFGVLLRTRFLQNALCLEERVNRVVYLYSMARLLLNIFIFMFNFFISLIQVLLFLFKNFKACKVIKKRLWHRCFPVSFAKIPKNTFSTEQLRTIASAYLFNCLFLI